MRLTKRRLWLVAAMLAISIAFTATTLAGAESGKSSNLPAMCNNNPELLSEFKPFSAKVWDLGRWRREKVSLKVIEAQRHRLKCAASPKHQTKMQKTWREDKKSFGIHQAKKLKARQIRESKEALIAEYASTLAAIRPCESGGDYSINTGNGFYGAYQFDLQTWGSVGGHGLPSDASKLEQDYRAALLLSSRGSSPWPVCG